MSAPESGGGRSLLGRLAGIVPGQGQGQGQARGHEVVAPDALDAWRARGARIVDVREPWEYAGGHVPGAVNVPMAELLGGLDDPEAPVVLVCASGARSSRAARALVARGFRDVADLGGGTRGWMERGLPLERGA